MEGHPSRRRQMVRDYITDLDTQIRKLEIECNGLLSQMEANNFPADRVVAFKGLQEKIKELVDQRGNLFVQALDEAFELDWWKLTWDDWLRQPLPYPDLVYEAGSGSTKRHTGFSPQDVKSWVEFQSKVDDHVSTFESGPRVSGDFHDLRKYTESTDAAIRHRFALVLGAFLSYEQFKDFTLQLSKRTTASREEGASRVGEPSAPPDSICDLKRLVNLNLSRTMLTSLPDSIGGLEMFSHLNLSNTGVTTLSDSAGDLKRLEKFFASKHR
ncbi:unnamed protein product [Calypogeia fissa]